MICNLKGSRRARSSLLQRAREGGAIGEDTVKASGHLLSPATFVHQCAARPGGEKAAARRLGRHFTGSREETGKKVGEF
jgi:hypothetical protein